MKIHKVQDIYPYLKERKETLLDWKWQLDHDALKRNYDGMEVFISDCWGLFHNHPLFWSWDVDSLVIWNMDKVKEIK